MNAFIETLWNTFLSWELWQQLAVGILVGGFLYLLIGSLFLRCLSCLSVPFDWVCVRAFGPPPHKGSTEDPVPDWALLVFWPTLALSASLLLTAAIATILMWRIPCWIAGHQAEKLVK